jgi:diaminopimelate decarboxylase
VKQRPVYEPPSLVRHQMGLMNKFGRQHAPRPLLEIDGVSIESLIAQHGSPLFVFSERTLVANYRDFYEAFSRRYPRVRMAWSYKTNYNEAICRVFHRQGAWAEVVSPFEYEKALRCGVAPEQIHWNGPYKPDEVAEKAARDGTIIHVDNFDEIVRMEAVAKRVGCRPRVAVRVNMAIEGLQTWSRVGLNFVSGQARDAVRGGLCQAACWIWSACTHTSARSCSSLQRMRPRRASSHASRMSC